MSNVHRSGFSVTAGLLRASSRRMDNLSIVCTDCYCRSDCRRAILIRSGVALGTLRLLVTIGTVREAIVAPTSTLAIRGARTHFNFLALLSASFLAWVVRRRIGFARKEPFTVVMVGRFPENGVKKRRAPLTAHFRRVRSKVPCLARVVFSFSFLRIRSFLSGLPLYFFLVH